MLFPLLVAAAACQKHSEPVSAAPAATPAAQSTSGSAGAADDPWGSKPPQKDPLPHPLLWSIEKDGKTSYALGTFHMGIDPTTRLPPVVWDKLDTSKTFAMETDISDRSLEDELTKRLDSKTLHGELGDAYWHKLEAAITPKVAASFDHATAALPATLLSMRGIPPTPPMDGVLLAHATNRGEKVVYLEPAEKQVKLLLKWMDARALEDMLDDLDNTEREQRELLAAYISGDEQQMLKVTDAERADWKKSGRTDADYDQMMDEMLYQRNASWIDGIDQLHAQGGGFIAVGAAHLIGKRSVLELLAKRGYKVTRITP